MVAEPGATAVTKPPVLTIATPVLSLDHETTRPVSGSPFWAAGVDVSCWLLPTVNEAELGLTPTEATGTAVTAIVDVPV
jgi:hypothetical protein